MNFEAYNVNPPQEIDFVDFYITKDFGKMGLEVMKVPYGLLDLIGDETPIEGLQVENCRHTFDYHYRERLYDEDYNISPREFEVVVYEAKDLRYRRKEKLTYQREEFGDAVRIVITPIFNQSNYNKAIEESQKEQDSLTDKFITDVIKDVNNKNKAQELMKKAVSTHGISQKAIDYFEEFKFLIE